jgi:hypothetical protein
VSVRTRWQGCDATNAVQASGSHGASESPLLSFRIRAAFRLFLCVVGVDQGSVPHRRSSGVDGEGVRCTWEQLPCSGRGHPPASARRAEGTAQDSWQNHLLAKAWISPFARRIGEAGSSWFCSWFGTILYSRVVCGHKREQKQLWQCRRMSACPNGCTMRWTVP